MAPVAPSSACGALLGLPALFLLLLLLRAPLPARGVLIECQSGPDVNLSAYGKTINFVLPQNFLDDGRGRYAGIIQKEIDLILNHRFNDLHYSPTDCIDIDLYASRMTLSYALGPFTLQIVEALPGIQLVFDASFHIDTPASIDAGVEVPLPFGLSFCIYFGGCPDSIGISFSVHFVGDFSLVIDPNTCLLSVESAGTVFIGVPVIDGCALNWLGDLVADFLDIDFQAVAEQYIQQVVAAIDAELNQRLSLPPETAVMTDVYIAYAISSVFVEDAIEVLVAAKSRVRAIDPLHNNQSVVYQDPVANREDFSPPSKYTLSPGHFYLTSSARISDATLHGLLWAYQFTGFNSASGSLQILDANISLYLTWEDLDFSIDPTNSMVAFVTNATVRGFCGQKLCIDVTVASLSGSMVLRKTQNSTTGQTGVYMELVKWFDDNLNITVRFPKLMLPAGVLDDFARSALTNCVSAINTGLASLVLWLPPALAPYTPNANVKIVNQPGCCGDEHGYFEFIIECSCVTDPIWPECFSLCTQENSLLENKNKFNASAALRTIRAAAATRRQPSRAMSLIASSRSPLSSSEAVFLLGTGNTSLVLPRAPQSPNSQPISKASSPLPLSIPLYAARSQRPSVLSLNGVFRGTLPQSPNSVLLAFNRYGESTLDYGTVFYSYTPSIPSSCILTPAGYWELLETPAIPLPSPLSLTLQTLCPNSSCTGCLVSFSNMPGGHFQTATFPVAPNLTAKVSFETSLIPSCIDFGAAVYSEYSECFWLELWNVFGAAFESGHMGTMPDPGSGSSFAIPVLYPILVCNGLQFYSLNQAPLYAVSNNATVFFGCTNASDTTTCPFAMKNEMHTCAYTTATNTTYACLNPYCGSQPIPPGPPPPSENQKSLVLVAVMTSVFSLVVIAAVIVAVWQRRRLKPHLQRIGLGALLYLRMGGLWVRDSCLRVGRAVRAFVANHLRDLSSFARLKEVLLGLVSVSILLQVVFLWLHYFAYQYFTPLSLFGANNLLSLGFGNQYVSLDKYNSTIATWQSFGTACFLTVNSLLTVAWALHLIFHMNRRILYVSSLLPILGFLLVYLVYPTSISFSFLISINPSSNQYLQDHPDTASTFSSLIGYGLSGVAIAFLTNLSLLLFSSVCLGALVSAWLQRLHQNVVVDAFLAILCAMIPFVVMIPAFVLYHAVSSHSIVWVLGWVCMLLGLCCGVGFLLRKIRDPLFLGNSQRSRFDQYFISLGTVFVIFSIIFIICTMYVEWDYNLVSPGYLILMMLSMALCGYSFCVVLRTTNPVGQLDPHHLGYVPVRATGNVRRQRTVVSSRRSGLVSINSGTTDEHDSEQPDAGRLLSGEAAQNRDDDDDDDDDDDYDYDDQEVQANYSRGRSDHEGGQGSNGVSGEYNPSRSLDRDAPDINTSGSGLLAFPPTGLGAGGDAKATTEPGCMQTIFKAIGEVFEEEEKFRFSCLLVGCPLLFALLINHYGIYSSTTARSDFVDVASGFINETLVWPSDGHTLLDPCFDQYDVVRKWQIVLFFCACICYFSCFLFQALHISRQRGPSSRFFTLSQISVLVGVLFSVASVVATSTPDYLSLVQVDSILPSCGHDFDQMVQSSVSLSIALVQMLISVEQAAGLIIALIPTCNRVIYTRIKMVRAAHVLDVDKRRVNVKEDSLRHMCVVISFMSVFITSLPMLALRQFSPDDNSVALSIMIPTFWLLPGLFLLSTRKRIKNPTTWYMISVWIYFGCLLSIVFVVLKNKISFIADNYLADPFFYVELFASIAISSVVIGDLFRLMFGDFELFITSLGLVLAADEDRDGEA